MRGIGWVAQFLAILPTSVSGDRGNAPLFRASTRHYLHIVAQARLPQHPMSSSPGLAQNRAELRVGVSTEVANWMPRRHGAYPPLPAFLLCASFTVGLFSSRFPRRTVRATRGCAAMRTGRAARKPRGGAGPALEWRLFGVEVLLLEDAASGDYNREPSVSSALHEAVARQLQIEPEQLPIENVRPL